jgi:hypothetical protein
MEHPDASIDEHLTVPTDNQPGHHPEHEQDKPGTEAFVARFNSAGREDASLTEEMSTRLEAARARLVPMLRDLRALSARLLRRAAEALEPRSSGD